MPVQGLYPSVVTANTSATANSSDRLDAQFSSKDASWILTSAVIIFSMQTGKFLISCGVEKFFSTGLKPCLTYCNT